MQPVALALDPGLDSHDNDAMFFHGMPTSRSLLWGVKGRQFRLTRAGEQLILDCSDGRLSLHLHEWQGVASALATLHPPPPPRRSNGNDAEVAARGRRAWMESEDEALIRGWYGGEGLALLAAQIGRSEAAITTRLIRLDLVGDRFEARQRP
ncbi:hypothetical protein [Sphingomonas sp.]|uniref:hypothetical protein n=1 Tax=Sphingomonas sp. TaxID=28214 RepID=UPI003CC68A75